jgi:methylase of polypeptide subunit release factors
MMASWVDRTSDEWNEASNANDRDIWVEHLDRVPVCDFFPVLVEEEALLKGTRQRTLSQWLNHMGGRRVADVEDEARSAASHLKLAAATYLRWIDRIETLLKTSRLPNLPSSGVVQYFTDHLAATVLIGYKRIGSTIQLENLLAIPNPEAYLDPLRALKFAETPAQLELLRRSLYSRHKIVIQRNTLVHIDRERAHDVFVPTIDTLFLNDWLHANRYAQQRMEANDVYFEDPVPREPTMRTIAEGQTFLEIGCGNGLLTASFAKNEAKIRAIAAIDVSHAAVSATYENAATQRHFHGSGISARAHFITGRYKLEIVPLESDLVVCNPPYIPELPGARGTRAHPLASATIGTTLLEQVLRDSPRLISASGELLMISSTLAEPEIRGSLPSKMNLVEVARRLVPFDIEAVRGEGEDEHISWLRAERGLEMRGKNLVHNIAIFRVRHTF